MNTRLKVDLFALGCALSDYGAGGRCAAAVGTAASRAACSQVCAFSLPVRYLLVLGAPLIKNLAPVLLPGAGAIM